MARVFYPSCLLPLPCPLASTLGTSLQQLQLIRLQEHTVYISVYLCSYFWGLSTNIFICYVLIPAISLVSPADRSIPELIYTSIYPYTTPCMYANANTIAGGWLISKSFRVEEHLSILSVHFALWRRMHLSKHVCKSRKVVIRTDISNPCGLGNGLEQGLHSTSLNSEEEPVRWSPLFLLRVC